MVLVTTYDHRPSLIGMKMTSVPIIIIDYVDEVASL